MLVEGVPAKHPRRTLTLVCATLKPRLLVCSLKLQIAKMLQNLANKPSYAKEAYMSTLNPFVENNKARINVFLNNLCEVGDFYETLEVSNFLVCEDTGLRFLSEDGPIHGTVQEGLANQHHLE